MLAVNIILNAIYYAGTLMLLPWLFLKADALFGLTRHSSEALRFVSVPLAVGGILLQVWTIYLFQKCGRGTPSPAVPPQFLVMTGPYRFLRNPMNLGEIMLFLALAAWFASPALFVYAAGAALAFHVFIVRWEEPRLRAMFGNCYIAYSAAVNRWLPHKPSSVHSDGVGRFLTVIFLL